MNSKKFKTIEEQLEILRSRGLIIPNEAQAKSFLLRNNYYRISGYSLTLRKNDIFFATATFQNIVDIYHFDQELRHILLTYLEIIEVQMKSIFTYEFTKIHGPLGYLNDSFFTDKSKHQQIINKANTQKMKLLSHEAYLKHFINDLKQDIPLWAYVDLFTISDISFLYSISEKPIKDAIAQNFGFTINRGSDLLKKYMHSMTILRNLCAHGGRIYNRLFEHKPSLNKREKALLIVNSNGQIDNAHLYGFLIVMRRLLPINSFKTLKQQIIELTDKFPFVRMDYYGFRNDWKELL